MDLMEEIEWLNKLTRQLRRSPCRACGSRKIVPIVYGVVPATLGIAEEEGRLRLGGCVLEAGQLQRW